MFMTVCKMIRPDWVTNTLAYSDRVMKKTKKYTISEVSTSLLGFGYDCMQNDYTRLSNKHSSLFKQSDDKEDKKVKWSISLLGFWYVHDCMQND
jgi:hypothetical protein